MPRMALRLAPCVKIKRHLKKVFGVENRREFVVQCWWEGTEDRKGSTGAKESKGGPPQGRISRQDRGRTSGSWPRGFDLWVTMADPLPSFFCPITSETMRDPVIIADGQTFERFQVEQWLQNNDTSPATGALLPHKNLTPNLALRNAIEEWEEAYAMHLRRADIKIVSGLGPLAVGSFKVMYKGTLQVRVKDGVAAKTITVAVLKMRRGDCSMEARMFLRLGRHPRLVRFLGQCIEGEEHLLLTEFAEMGSLSDAFETWEDKITLGHQMVMMQQIAQGMDHLAGAGVVHRDLAARNVLVFCFDEKDVLKTSVKITDYGLAANFYDRSHITLQTETLPIRYMSVEALERGR